MRPARCASRKSTRPTKSSATKTSGGSMTAMAMIGVPIATQATRGTSRKRRAAIPRHSHRRIAVPAARLYRMTTASAQCSARSSATPRRAGHFGGVRSVVRISSSASTSRSMKRSTERNADSKFSRPMSVRCATATGSCGARSARAATVPARRRGRAPSRAGSACRSRR